jgi:hypothetical protein
MSLTATLLLNQPITLPRGRARPPHYLDGKSAAHASRSNGSENNAKTMQENAESVRAAIAAGCTRIDDLVDATGLSKSTVQKRVHQLIDAGVVAVVFGKRNIMNLSLSDAH